MLFQAWSRQRREAGPDLGLTPAQLLSCLWLWVHLRTLLPIGCLPVGCPQPHQTYCLAHSRFLILDAPGSSGPGRAGGRLWEPPEASPESSIPGDLLSSEPQQMCCPMGFLNHEVCARHCAKAGVPREETVAPPGVAHGLLGGR